MIVQKNYSVKFMFQLVLLCILVTTSISIASKNWSPTNENEANFDEPFDFVDHSYLPNLVTDESYDWISSSGTSLTDLKKSYIAFSGTRRNNAKNYSSVYTQESGIVVLCESSKTDQINNINMKCKTLEQRSLQNKNGLYFGAVVKSAQFSQDTVAFIYCDPLWSYGTIKFTDPMGKCNLSLIKDFNVDTSREFQVSRQRCLGGFSVDIMSSSQKNINILYGLPFCDSIVSLPEAQSRSMALSETRTEKFNNYGYSVAFDKDGVKYVSSPSSDEKSDFVEMLNVEKFYPPNQSNQKYGGFGTSMDTIEVKKNLYGAVIGAPYQGRHNSPNVGAVFLACKSHSTDMVSGESKDDYFGYAVARIGFLDDSESEAFAVSAPRLNNDKPGKIYIFKSTPNCQILKKPTQIYQSDIKGFGIALSRGFDIDFNGWPDFFVTSLNSTKPSLFKMPNQVKVDCHWSTTLSNKILRKGEIFELKIIFQADLQINFKDYLFQVALDFSNKGEKRFELKSSELKDNIFFMKVKLLSDVIDMDLKSTPFNVDIKATRSCKGTDNKNCFKSNAVNIKLSNSNKTIKLLQHVCNSVECTADLMLKVRPDANGTVIYFGNPKTYIRKLELIVSNSGPEVSERIFMSIQSNPDIKVIDVKCNSTCTPWSPLNGQMIIKETSNNVKVLVDILYDATNGTNSKSSIDFKIWGIYEDPNLLNNQFKLNYSIVFKPNLRFSSNKVSIPLVDKRKKPPYLGGSKLSVHDIGTDITYSYLIENQGPELNNVEFRFKFPYKTIKDEFILYLMDKIRIPIRNQDNSVLPSFFRNDKRINSCVIPSSIINPLKITGVEIHGNGSMHESGYSERNKRSIQAEDLSPHILSSNDSNYYPTLSQSESAMLAASADRSEQINCNGTSSKLGIPVCIEIVCKLDKIPMKSVFNFDFRTWLFTKTFFEARIPDLVVTTSLESNFGDFPPGLGTPDDRKTARRYSISQKVIFKNIKVVTPRPLWPIIVAIVIGIIVLIIIVIIAYYCGFFKRNRLKREMKKKKETRLKNLTDDKHPLNSS